MRMLILLVVFCGLAVSTHADTPEEKLRELACGRDFRAVEAIIATAHQ